MNDGRDRDKKRPERKRQRRRDKERRREICCMLFHCIHIVATGYLRIPELIYCIYQYGAWRAYRSMCIWLNVECCCFRCHYPLFGIHNHFNVRLFTSLQSLRRTHSRLYTEKEKRIFISGFPRKDPRSANTSEGKLCANVTACREFARCDCYSSWTRMICK